MERKNFLFHCILLSVSWYCVAQAPQKHYEWDYFVYTQQWPEGACIDANNSVSEVAKRKHHICIIPENVTTWAVHGLWPDKLNTTGPNNCDPADKFDIKLIEPLIPQMNKSWPNFFKGTAFGSFWKHEWEKHGTCAQDLEIVKGEYKYFNMGLQLNRKYDLLSLLKEQGVVPSATKPYDISTLTAAAEAALKHKVEVRCTYDHATEAHYLFEIEMCLNKNITPIDCPPRQLQMSEACPNTKPIYYLPIIPEATAEWSEVTPEVIPEVIPEVVPGKATEKERGSFETNSISGQSSVRSEIREVIDEEKPGAKEPGNAERNPAVGQELVVEEEIEVVMQGKQVVVEDTKLVFKAHDEEKAQNEDAFVDMWEKMVEEILEG